MKLEYHHLAAFLPFKLQLQWHDGQIGMLTGLDTEQKTNKYFRNGFSAMVTRDKKMGLKSSMPAGSHQIKPILRPLSDLVKEVVISGEKFIPLVRLLQWNETNYWHPNPMLRNGIKMPYPPIISCSENFKRIIWR